MCPTVICIMPEISNNVCPVKKQPKAWLQYWKSLKKIVCLHVCTTVINETVPGWWPWSTWEAQSSSETDGKLMWIILSSLSQLGGSCCPSVGCVGCTFSAGLACPSSSALRGAWVPLGCPEKAPWGLWVLPWHWKRKLGPARARAGSCAGMEACAAGMQILEADSLWEHSTHVVHWATSTYSHMCGTARPWRPWEVSWSPLFKEKITLLERDCS